MELIHRPRRLRRNPAIRKLVRETRMDKSSLVYPIFVMEGENLKEEIPSMPGQYRYSVDRLPEALYQTKESGVSSVMFFGIPDRKDACGSGAWSEDGIIQTALRIARKEVPDLFYISDVCMCEYTSHGHCGILDGDYVDNDRTLDYLARIALSQIKAGADMVAPSDMMDGRIAVIRSLLDMNGYTNVPIMSYAAKYASSFYGPFRDAAESTPASGDRKSYQMDYHNRKEAIKEMFLDIGEGADIIMIKPALSYLDIIREASDKTQVPIAAYSVSGEYSMVKASARLGYMNEADLICESAVSIFRAGAGILISYFAKELAGFMDEGRIG